MFRGHIVCVIQLFAAGNVFFVRLFRVPPSFVPKRPRKLFFLVKLGNGIKQISAPGTPIVTKCLGACAPVFRDLAAGSECDVR